MPTPPSPCKDALGHAIRKHRGKLSQREVEPATGIPAATLSRLERGTHKPSTATARALARWLGWTVEQVIQATTDPAPHDSASAEGYGSSGGEHGPQHDEGAEDDGDAEHGELIHLHPHGPPGAAGPGAGPRADASLAAAGRGAEAHEAPTSDERAGPESRPRTLIYVETSALLCWLFGEARRDEVAHWLDLADGVLTSDLTFLEAHRALAREEAGGASSLDVATLRDALGRLALSWWVLPISDRVVRWAANPFKIEPVRSLDAIHLASAQMVEMEHGNSIVFVSLDRRVRLNAIAYSFNLIPLSTTQEDLDADRLARKRRS